MSNVGFDEAISQICNWLRSSNATYAFTGAGISTESGIPDFRSPGGVWAKNRTVYFDEFCANAADRYEYWRQKAESHRDFATHGKRRLKHWYTRYLRQVVEVPTSDSSPHGDAVFVVLLFE